MIYIIMVFEKIDTYKITKPDGTIKDTMWADFGDERIVGYYNSLDTAVSAVIGNWGDIRETCYDYAVIEGVEEGIYPTPFPEDTYWFQFDKDKKEYYRIAYPECCKHQYGFTIG